MTALKQKTNLEPHIKEQLGEMLSQLRPPVVILKLLDDVLTPEEARLVGNAGIGTPADPRDWVNAKKILRVVAERRQLSLERALLEMALSLDIIGIGRYTRLRRDIGEPVQKMAEVPMWDPESGELRFRNQVVRYVDVLRGKNIQRILTRFQEAGWRSWIPNPFPEKPSTLAHAVETLNEGLRRIRFARDGKGGVVWREDS